MNELLLKCLYSVSFLYFWIILHNFIKAYLELKNVKPFKVIIDWIVAFCILLSINLHIKIDIINMFAFFLVIMLIQVYLYRGDMTRKFLLAVFLCIMVLTSEYMAVSAIAAVNKIEFMKVLQNSSCVLSSAIFSKIICVIIVKKVGGLITRQKTDKAIYYWVSLLGITFGSVYLTYIFIYFNYKISDSEFVINTTLAFGCILLIDMFVFYLCNYTLEQTDKNMNTMLYKQQTKYYERQYRESKESEKRIRRLRHDMKNHLFCIREYAKKESYVEIIEYIDNISNDTFTPYCKVNCGNLVIDSIVNYKASEAEQHQIKFHIQLEIPPDINIAHSDLSVILGNSLDNAIEASKKEKTIDRKITIIMKYHSKNIYICVSNFYSGELERDSNNRILTTKLNKEFHGLGLKSIESIAEKYCGAVFVTDQDNLFQIEILLFNGG